MQKPLLRSQPSLHIRKSILKKTHINVLYVERSSKFKLEKFKFENSHLTILWRNHSGEKLYKYHECCSFCVCRLSYHQIIYNGKKPCKYNDCLHVFSQNSYLIICPRIHTGEKPCKCNECGRFFSVLLSLTGHEVIHDLERV